MGLTGSEERWGDSTYNLTEVWFLPRGRLEDTAGACGRSSNFDGLVGRDWGWGQKQRFLQDKRPEKNLNWPQTRERRMFQQRKLHANKPEAGGREGGAEFGLRHRRGSGCDILSVRHPTLPGDPGGQGRGAPLSIPVPAQGGPGRASVSDGCVSECRCMLCPVQCRK